MLGAPPGIDRLVGIPDDIDPGRRSKEQFDEFELDVVGILELVDQDVVELICPFEPDIGILVQDGEALEDEIVEIEDEHLPLLFFVILEEGNEDLLIGEGLALIEVLGIFPEPLLVADVGDGVLHDVVALLIPLLLGNVLHEAALLVLVEDVETRWIADKRGFAPHDPRAEGVEGHDVQMAGGRIHF